MCGPVVLEMLYSARNGEDYRVLRETLDGLEQLRVDEGTFARAVEVQAVLAERGRLREVGVADLLIAAAAELSRVTLLHYDADFETVARSPSSGWSGWCGAGRCPEASPSSAGLGTE